MFRFRAATTSIAAITGFTMRSAVGRNSSARRFFNWARIGICAFRWAESLAAVPMAAEDYYGPNANLSAALKAGGNTWKPVYREAKGNALQVTGVRGTIRRAYPLVVQVDAEQTAEFQVTGGIGYVPFTFIGLSD